MLNSQNPTLLRELHLSAMAKELEYQMENPRQYESMSFDDRLAHIIEAERSNRNKNTIQRRIKEAHFPEHACMEDIEYHPDRKLDKGMMTTLGTSTYIKEHHHIILRGATGAGKTYIGSALGNAACRKHHKVSYTRLPELLNECMVARSIGTYDKVMDYYRKKDLLIIDEWLLRPLPEQETFELLEIVEACARKGSLIICSQYDTADWYYRLDANRSDKDNSTVAEAILDRIIHNSYNIFIDGKVSMRERHAFSAPGNPGEGDTHV